MLGEKGRKEKCGGLGEERAVAEKEQAAGDTKGGEDKGK